MPTVTAVKLRFNPKSYWFDPRENNPQQGDHVLVETERGREIGLVVDPCVEVTSEQIAALKTPLKPVVRVLNETDYDRIDELDERGRAAMPVFREYVEKYELEMRPVDVEFLFSGDKAVFYFTSDNRIDFRDLVRDLAAHFHMRIDMRQIGARDEARMVGGLAHCGEILCCARFGGEFDSVSIRMAKEQDLSLNPVKISGACGRLMCCLRYEFEAYKEFKQRAPKKGTLIETPLGSAKVTGLDTPREVIHMRFEDGKQLSIPLADIECTKDKEGCISCCRVDRDAIDRCASSSVLLALSALDRELEQKDDLTDVAMEVSAGRPPVRRRHRSEGEGAAADKRSKGAKSAKGARVASNDAARKEDSDDEQSSSRGGRRPRNRSSRSGGKQAAQQTRRQQPTAVDSPAASTEAVQSSEQQQRPQSASKRKQTPKRTDKSSSRTKQQKKQQGQQAAHQRPADQQPANKRTKQQSQQSAQPGAGAQQARPRPGQKSSGLRNPQQQSQGQARQKQARPEQQGAEKSYGRRRRERSGGQGTPRDASKPDQRNDT